VRPGWDPRFVAVGRGLQRIDHGVMKVGGLGYRLGRGQEAGLGMHRGVHDMKGMALPAERRGGHHPGEAGQQQGEADRGGRLTLRQAQAGRDPADQPLIQTRVVIAPPGP
jgi:hypothetical protein